MAAAVFIETDKSRKAKKSSLEAIAYARTMNNSVTAFVLGAMGADALNTLGKYGANKIVHVADEKLDQGIVKAYATVLAQLIATEKVTTFVVGDSLLGVQVAARVAVRIGAAFVPNVIDTPDTTSGFMVKQSIYAGKASMHTTIENPKKVIVVKKNTTPAVEVGVDAEVIAQSVSLADTDFDVAITPSDDAVGDVPLSEAEIVVSGGRGMKGPEKWNLLEDLAGALGATLGCSKPVSDMNWRPHHEHVGQTGIKIAPQLYIAVGISGAIQHLAGVNASKCIVVINNDPEAPFFKAADYGIVGDAAEVLPKLTAAIKAYMGP